MAEKYDVIVAGAGMAGLPAATMAAKKGAKVLLLDRNNKENVGRKTNWGWVCGDAVAKSHLDFIKSNLGLSFSHPELDHEVEGVYAISPDFKSQILFDEGSGYILNRPLFEGKMLDHALKQGVEYLPNFEVERPIIENNYVVGIAGKDEKKEHKEFRAKVVIDALGISTTIRRLLPENEYVERMVDIDDLELTGRFLYEFELDHEDPLLYNQKYALIHLNQVIAPGGYGWVFPKNGNRANIGIGVQKRSLEIRNKKLNKKDTLQSLMKEYATSIPVFKNMRIYNEGPNGGEGYWSVAVRHQMEALTFNGYLGAGDSMVMPNPISAGGIGPALTAGVLAGINAADAISKGDVSIRGLWKYNLDFNEHYGKKSASLEVFRVYLQSLNNDIINYGMKVFLTASEAKQLSYGLVPELSLAAKFKTILQGAKNINAFRNLLYVVNKMKEINKIYEEYPKTPEEFGAWKKKIKQEVEEVKEKFKPNPV
ncbi:MAG: NAD(P)/FAD-dependent oxidoreductase [Candidatus Micrarchaeia archaeon]